MNGVFGSGGRFRASPEKQQDAVQQAQQTLEDTQQQMDQLLLRQKQMGRNLHQAEEMARQSARAVDSELQSQAQQIRRMSADLAQDLQADGLLTPVQAQAAQPAQTQAQRSAAFEAAAQVVNRQLLGQEEFVQELCRAFQRPMLCGASGQQARAVTLISGGWASGRSTALTVLTRELAAQKLLASGQVAWIDLGLYPGPGEEKLFLQDLYAALAGPAQVVAFRRYEQCHPGFLYLVGTLLSKGEAALNSRYVVRNGLLVDVGTALAPNTVGSLTPQGKYFFFVSEKGLDALAQAMGTGFAKALGPVCSARPLDQDTQLRAAQVRLDRMKHQVGETLGMTLTRTQAVDQLAADQYSPAEGMQPVIDWCLRCQKAVSEYKLRTGEAAAAQARLDVQDGTLVLLPEGGQPVALLDLLPQVRTTELDAVKRKMKEIVGLEPVKEYILGLADHAQVQKRRAAAGLPANRVSMHMIFAGNPGTGKTTMARLAAQYLKAVGVLRGGQLVEVNRADLVGRYVGHTAPLTNQVIASALGGVLFIDEAYSLYRGRDDSFGLEAIDTLVKGMEDHRDDLVVVLAGYTREMQTFLEANSGLASRFPNHIEFPDYTAEQLMQILEIQAKSKGYRILPECREPILAWLAGKQADDPAKHGNGRMVRNLLEAAILRQARRLVDLPDAALDELQRQDFDLDE